MLTETLPAGWLPALGTTWLVIALAEIGDKSQLVCMTLAARHRPWPVAAGAIAAFCLLNLLAVMFGAALAAFLPGWLLTAAVALLFGFFGIQSFRQVGEDDEEIEEKSGHSLFLTSFLLIFIAEFGDKTQIAVAGFASTADLYAVWLGANLALACTSLLGVFAGAHWLKKLPMDWLHRAAGTLFLLMALLALFKLASG